MLVQTFIQSLCLAMATGIISTVYMCILPYEEFFSFWWKFGNQFENRWFFKPIWGCQKCFAGQFSLWYYLLAHLSSSKIVLLGGIVPFPAIFIHCLGYSLIGHLFCVTGAIFSSIIFSYILKQTTNE